MQHYTKCFRKRPLAWRPNAWVRLLWHTSNLSYFILKLSNNNTFFVVQTCFLVLYLSMEIDDSSEYITVASGCTEISILSSVNISKTFITTVRCFLKKKTLILALLRGAWILGLSHEASKFELKKTENIPNNTAQSVFQKTIPYYLCI